MSAWPGEHRQHAALGLDGVADDEIQLGAVAGGERHCLLDRGATAQVAQELDRERVRQREPLTHLDGRGPIRRPDR